MTKCDKHVLDASHVSERDGMERVSSSASGGKLELRYVYSDLQILTGTRPGLQTGNGLLSYFRMCEDTDNCEGFEIRLLGRFRHPKSSATVCSAVLSKMRSRDKQWSHGRTKPSSPVALLFSAREVSLGWWKRYWPVQKSAQSPFLTDDTTGDTERVLHQFCEEEQANRVGGIRIG